MNLIQLLAVINLLPLLFFLLWWSVDTIIGILILIRWNIAKLVKFLHSRLFRLKKGVSYNKFLEFIMINSSILGGRKIIQRRSFLQRKELSRFVRIALQLSPFSISKSSIILSSSMLLSRRILLLWKKSDSKFLVQYLKECIRLIRLYKTGGTFVISPGVSVRRDKIHLPLTLPKELRRRIANDHMVRLIMTIFNVFRIINVDGKESIKSIISPFSGRFKTLPIIPILLESLNIHPISKLKIDYTFRSMSSGPGGNLSFLRAGLDASILLLKFPKIFILLIYLSTFYTNGKWYHLLLVFSAILNIPLLLFVNHRWIIGKLSILNEGAGKFRVVGLLDYWTQLIMKPIHDEIFKILKTIPMDCTHDQDGVISRSNKNNSNYPAWSFDLSEATDRLPIDLQRDILSANLALKYSVGQPMGGYSSFAMLALTHHYIVQYSAFIANVNDYQNYTIFGDDIVLRRFQSVSDTYLGIMNGLGVKINAFKSIISDNGSCEFTKRIWTQTGVISPVGARSILGFMRSWTLVNTLIMDYFKKSELPMSFNKVVGLLDRLNLSNRRKAISVLHLFSPYGLHSKSGYVILSYYLANYKPVFKSISYETLLMLLKSITVERIRDKSNFGKELISLLHYLMYSINSIMFLSWGFWSCLRFPSYFEIWYLLQLYNNWLISNFNITNLLNNFKLLVIGKLIKKIETVIFPIDSKYPLWNTLQELYTLGPLLKRDQSQTFRLEWNKRQDLCNISHNFKPFQFFWIEEISLRFINLTSMSSRKVVKEHLNGVDPPVLLSFDKLKSTEISKSSFEYSSYVLKNLRRESNFLLRLKILILLWREKKWLLWNFLYTR